MDKKDWASLIEAPPETTAASADREVIAYVESWEHPTKKSTATLHNLRIKYGKLVLLDEAEPQEGYEEGGEEEEEEEKEERAEA